MITVNQVSGDVPADAVAAGARQHAHGGPGRHVDVANPGGNPVAVAGRLWGGSEKRRRHASCLLRSQLRRRQGLSVNNRLFVQWRIANLLGARPHPLPTPLSE